MSDASRLKRTDPNQPMMFVVVLFLVVKSRQRQRLKRRQGMLHGHAGGALYIPGTILHDERRKAVSPCHRTSSPMSTVSTFLRNHGQPSLLPLSCRCCFCICCSQSQPPFEIASCVPKLVSVCAFVPLSPHSSGVSCPLPHMATRRRLAVQYGQYSPRPAVRDKEVRGRLGYLPLLACVCAGRPTDPGCYYNLETSKAWTFV